MFLTIPLFGKVFSASPVRKDPLSILAILIMGAWAAASHAAERKVLIFGIDGLRADAFRMADTPHLNGLKRDGALAANAVTDVKARSGPGWTSILTGVWSWKHGVRDNAFNGYRADSHPTFMERIVRERPGTVVGAVVNWKPIGSNLFGRRGFWIAPGDDDAVAEEAAKLIGQGIPDVLFTHFDGVDHGANTPSDRIVFLLANGPGCRRERPTGFRGVVDVAPTAFAFLGIPVSPEWKWDGKPLGYEPAIVSDAVTMDWARAAGPVGVAATPTGRQQP